MHFPADPETAEAINDDNGNVYIYLLNAISTPRYKIGVSINIKQRLTSMARGQSPYPIRLCAYYSAPRDDEKILHWKYQKYRVHGEWFEFDEAQLLSVYNRFRHQFCNCEKCYYIRNPNLEPEPEINPIVSLQECTMLLQISRNEVTKYVLPEVNHWLVDGETYLKRQCLIDWLNKGGSN